MSPRPRTNNKIDERAYWEVAPTWTPFSISLEWVSHGRGLDKENFRALTKRSVYFPSPEFLAKHPKGRCNSIPSNTFEVSHRGHISHIEHFVFQGNDLSRSGFWGSPVEDPTRRDWLGAFTIDSLKVIVLSIFLFAGLGFLGSYLGK